MWELWETRLVFEATGIAACERKQVHVCIPPPTMHMRVRTRRESEIQGGGRDERNVKFMKDTSEFVGLYLGSTRLETQSEPAGAAVLMASAGSQGSRQAGKVGFRYQNRGRL